MAKKEYAGVAVWATVSMLTLVVVAVADALLTHPWGHTLIDGNETYRCEETDLSKLVREPANAYSNFSFYIAGVYFLVASVVDALLLSRGAELSVRAEQLNVGHFPSVLGFVGCSMIFLGIGSFYYHANAGKDGPPLSQLDQNDDGKRDGGLGAYLDLAGVFLVILALCGAAGLLCGITSRYLVSGSPKNQKVLYCLWAWFGISTVLAAAWKPLFGSVMEIMLFVMLFIFAALLGSLGLSVYYARKRRLGNNYDKVLVPLSACSCIIAVAAWIPEEILGKCVLDGIELHAVWHAFLGICIFLAIVWARALDRRETFWQVTLLYYTPHQPICQQEKTGKVDPDTEQTEQIEQIQLA